MNVSAVHPGRHWRMYLVLLACALLGHAQLLMADGVRWDDALLYKLDQTGDHADLREWMMQMGLPINYLFFRTVFAFPGYGSHLVLSFLSILLCAILLYRYLTAGPRWNAESAALLSALFIFALPFKSTVLLSTLQYQFSLVFFLLACHLAEKRFGPHGRAWLLAALVLFFLSFNTASLLAYFYVYFLASCLAFVRFHDAPRLRAIRIWLGKSWFLMLWPFAYFGLKLSLFPTYGPYQNYNKLSFDPRRISTTTRIYFEDGFANPISQIARMDAQLPLALIPLAAVIFLLLRSARAQEDRSDALSLRGIRIPLYLLGVAFCLSFLPYVLVGQAPRPFYWESRHLLLFTITIPMAIFAIVRLASLPFRGEAFNARCVARLATAGICAVFCLVGYVSYFIVQIGSIKQHAIVENLRKLPRLKEYDYFSVVDNAKDFAGNRLSLYEATHENYYGWAFLFTRAWGEERWFGYSHDEFRKDRPYRLGRYGTSRINTDGRWCTLTIDANPGRTQWQIYRQYYWYKFVEKDKLRPFLESLVSISGCES